VNSKSSGNLIKLKVGFLFIPNIEIDLLIKDLNDTKRNITLNCIDEIKRKFYEFNGDRNAEIKLSGSRDSFLNTTNSHDLEELHIISQPEELHITSQPEELHIISENNTEELLNEENNIKIGLFDTSKKARNKTCKSTSTTLLFEILHTLCSTPLPPYPLTRSVYTPTYNDLSITLKASGQNTSQIMDQNTGQNTDQNTGQITDQNTGQITDTNTGQITNLTKKNPAVSTSNSSR
jgi:hypothetical protein